jgi:peptidoglycan/LPS O-acetylase OafA/YrhL
MPQSLFAYATLPFAYGAIGVPILFVVSGYVIHRRSAAQLAGGVLKFSGKEFLLRRAVRIYPTFICAILLTIVCDNMTKMLISDHYKLGKTDGVTLIINLAALQGVIGPSFGSNGPLWSLALEIQFYAVYPLALLLRARIGALPMLCGVICFSALGWLALKGYGIIVFPQYYLAWWLGAYLADREAAGEALSWAWLVVPIVAIPVGCYLQKVAPFWGFMIWAIGVMPIVGWSTRLRSRGFSFLKWIGGFSYSLYAAHLPVIVLASALILKGRPSSSIIWSFIIAVLVAIVSYIFYLIAERPAIRFLERMSFGRPS